MNYAEYINLSNEEKFNYFMSTIFPTNRTPKYWVNWDKVRKNIQEYELSLNTLNYLVGKDNIMDEAKMLFQAQPQLLRAIPVLLASRDAELTVLELADDGAMNHYDVNFDKPDISKIDIYLKFMEETGLLEFLQKDLNQSLVDYVYGVETGLDSNARKNRGGTQNEIILERNLKSLCNSNPNLEYKTQATRNVMKKDWSIDVPELLPEGKKGGRRYDGAILNRKTNKTYIVETNFYGSGGSKLKSVAGEFSNMYIESLKGRQDIDFIWITDGPGWKTARNPLSEAFNAIPKIFNLNMIKNDFLSDAVKGF
ncbi:type II restriction endonuclease [Lactobacillus sp. ESL0731]|uniref:type II restriction endonuclease n=1 Tax=unclassified Lactobacillus TaxID=2620435 RepID=UPI0023F68689|nr:MULTISPECIES: type II restriction endonuclease [unclassified Lactobacillus]WEV51605.1 type II restriction endonuclease [Lactobacillus sp. ESL0700]WEV62734.1 type II restriction endonuclease [Lactobacillus sp. ESL0731]